MGACSPRREQSHCTCHCYTARCAFSIKVSIHCASKKTICGIDPLQTTDRERSHVH
jgi:hypothetical protein